MAMLQINHVLKLYKREKKYLKFLKKEHGGHFTVKSWDDGKEKTRRIKNRFSSFLLNEQHYKCVYCHRVMICISKEIDHIACKKLHPDYTFDPYNLVYACSFCNERAQKGDKETIDVKGAYYLQNRFLMVHPYLDIVDNHFVYQDNDKIIINYPNCSDEAKFTCDMFELHRDEMTLLRSREFKLAKEAPIPNQTLKGFIKKAVAYKKRV